MLLILLPKGRKQQEGRGIYLLLGRSDTDGVFRELRGVATGDYDVFAYDVEWDGIIRSGSPAFRGVASVTQGSSTGNYYMYTFCLESPYYSYIIILRLLLLYRS